MSILFRPIDNYTEDLWLLEGNNSRKLTKSLLSLRWPKLDRRNRFRQAVTSRNVTIPISNRRTDLFGKMALSTSINASFVLDSNTNIVYVLSASDYRNYVGQLKYDFGKVFTDNNTPCGLAVCTQRDDVMYVGHKTSLISVFKLKYKTF